jgi:[ribosomal protein S5]-alanine N-acetyltransferase
MTVTRIASVDDAAALAATLQENRAFLAHWEPLRDDSYFSVEGQQAALGRALEGYARDSTVPLVILDDGQVLGRITINGITRGAFQSASIGYWVSQSHNGRGLATAAVADVITIAFAELGLHRLQAETLLYNTASQRVLTRSGFRPFGIAPSYLKIAGKWQDHVLFHAFNPADPPR